MRFLTFLMILAGLVISFGLPLYQSQFSNFEITTQRVYDQTTGPLPFGVELTPVDGPILLEVTLRPQKSTLAPGQNLMIFIKGDGPDGNVLAQTITIDRESPEMNNDFSLFTKGFTPFDVPVAGRYDFVLDLLGGNGLEAETIDLKLIGRAQFLETDYGPIGYALIAVGTVGFLFSGFRRNSGGGRNVPKAPTRGPWSGGGKTSSIGRSAPEPKTKQSEPTKPKVTWGRGE